MAKEKSIKKELVPSFQLYKVEHQIDNFIETFIDKETGEIIPYAEGYFNKLQIKKEEAIHQIALSHLTNEAKSEVVSLEIKRLQSLKKSIDNRSKLAKRILEHHVAEGETYEFENAKIGWRKSAQVDVDELLDLSELVLEYPDLIIVQHSLNKNEVKAMVKNDKPLPVGIEIIEKQNLQIK